MDLTANRFIDRFINRAKDIMNYKYLSRQTDLQLYRKKYRFIKLKRNDMKKEPLFISFSNQKGGVGKSAFTY